MLKRGTKKPRKKITQSLTKGEKIDLLYSTNDASLKVTDPMYYFILCRTSYMEDHPTRREINSLMPDLIKDTFAEVLSDREIDKLLEIHQDPILQGISNKVPTLIETFNKAYIQVMELLSDEDICKASTVQRDLLRSNGKYLTK